MEKRDESWEDYLYRVQDNPGTFAQFHGCEPFKELFEESIITPCITAIRLMYTGAIDLIFMVNEDGRLVNIAENDVFDKNCESFDPEEMLSGKIYPFAWWEIEGFKPINILREEREHETVI